MKVLDDYNACRRATFIKLDIGRVRHSAPREIHLCYAVRETGVALNT